MAKINNGAVISYGPTLPAAATSVDGALFYKTGDVGTPQGLYLYGFVSDANAASLGGQVSQAWIMADTPSTYVDITGDTMTGQLTVPSFLKITQTTGAQRLVIGNSTAGGLNKPSIIEGQDGVVRIGTGTTWTGAGGTLANFLSVDVNTAAVAASPPAYAKAVGALGLKYLGGQVWHAGNHGPLSTLDADLLDGQHGAYYTSLTNQTGILPVTKGGTGVVTAPTPGAVMYGASASTIGYTAVGGATFNSGTAQVWNILTAAGSGAPLWVPSTSLNVSYATSAGSATTATTAGSATTASSAGSVPWSGITGLITPQTIAASPQAGSTGYARPSFFYDFGNTGIASPGPTAFSTVSLSGFDAYSTSDLGQYQVGLTVRGISTNAFQLIAGWNFEEGMPSGLRFRVNDDTGTTSAWGQIQTLWDTSNLTNLSQLANGPGYLTGASLSNYVLKTGDTISGSLTVQNNVIVGDTNGDALTVNGITLHWQSSLIQTTGAVSALGNLVTTGGNIIGSNSGVISAGSSNGTTGFIRMQASGSGNSGYLEFFGGSNSIRAGYIGNTGTVATQDTGTVNYVGGSHAFAGQITCNNNITAYSSDGRLKKNVTVIEDAVAKVKSLGGYAYDWDMGKCNEVGFSPANEHEHGLIAQEVQKVMPDAVAPAPFNEEYLTVRYERIVALLTAALNEQQRHIESLEARLAEVERHTLFGA